MSVDWYQEAYLKKQNKSDRSKLITIFKKAKSIEEATGKNIFEFGQKEIDMLLPILGNKSRETIHYRCGLIDKYCKWVYKAKICKMENKLFSVNNIKSMTIKIIPITTIRRKYFCQSKIMEFLDKLTDVSNQFILYSIFIGISGKDFMDLCNLKMDDIDKEKMVAHLRLSNRDQEIDYLFDELAEKTNRQEYYNPGDNDVTYENLFTKYKNNGYIIKIPRQKEEKLPAQKNFIESRLKVIKKQTGNQYISKPTLERSGLLYFIRCKCSEYEISFNDIFMAKSNDKCYTYAEELQDIITQYGSNIKGRILRDQIEDIYEWEDKYKYVPNGKSKYIQKLSIKELLKIINDEGYDIKDETTRSNSVKRLAIKISEGICQLCNAPAPFSVRGEPYLEAHHIISLADGGKDTIENVIALCPNCHREMHYALKKASYDKLCNIAKTHFEKASELARQEV